LNLDGVLSSEQGEPIRAGVQLYYALNNGHRVALMTSRNQADAEHWLASHGIVGYDDLIDSSFHLEGENLKKRQFTLSRSRAPIELYVDSDPHICAWVFEEQRVPILMFGSPVYSKIENRPSAPRSVRKWSEIEESVTRVNLAKVREYTKTAPELGEWSD